MLTTLHGYSVLKSSEVEIIDSRLYRYFLAIKEDQYRVMREHFCCKSYASGELVLIDTICLDKANTVFDRKL